MSLLLVVAAVAAVGLAAGQLKVRGVGLGVAGVLFSGLLAGHLLGDGPLQPDAHGLEVLRDFGLVVFVYAVGAQVGPGFMQSLREGGLRLNACAIAIVALGALLAVALARLLHIDMAAMVGVFAGATTNTPALGAAQQALGGLRVDEARHGLPGLGYAVAYPFGVVGIIGSIVLLRVVFRIDAQAEARRAEQERQSKTPRLARQAFVVDNANLDGLRVKDLPALVELGVVVSRLRSAGGEAMRAAPDQRLQRGDALLCVGTEAALAQTRNIIGPSTSIEPLLAAQPARVASSRLVVTHKDVVGTSLGALSLDARFDVTVTRVQRGGVELVAAPSLALRFGDLLHVVGAADDVAEAAAVVGNSEKALGLTDFLPIFVGVALGVWIGGLALPVSGMPAPIKLGLAGGPLLVAILLGRVGKIGPLVWHMPGAVNLALRELGIVLFLSAVGLKGGAHLVSALRDGGLVWVGCGAAITVVPLLVVGAVARVALRLDFATLAGTLAGAMTDPPALVFTNALVGADAAAVPYAAVYPTTMVLRILCAQALVIWFA